MKGQKVKNIIWILGVSILLVTISLGLPQMAFYIQNGLKQKVLINREDSPVCISLAKNPSEVSLSYQSKVELASGEDVVPIELYNNVSMEESVSLDTDKALKIALRIIWEEGEDKELAVLLDNIAKEEVEWEAENEYAILNVVDTYAVLLMDRKDFNRQYKAWEVFIRVGNYMFGGWLDDETGRYTAIWYGDSYERIPQEALLSYYGEWVE